MCSLQMKEHSLLCITQFRLGVCSSDVFRPTHVKNCVRQLSTSYEVTEGIYRDIKFVTDRGFDRTCLFFVVCFGVI